MAAPASSGPASSSPAPFQFVAAAPAVAPSPAAQPAAAQAASDAMEVGQVAQVILTEKNKQGPDRSSKPMPFLNKKLSDKMKAASNAKRDEAKIDQLDAKRHNPERVATFLDVFKASMQSQAQPGALTALQQQLKALLR